MGPHGANLVPDKRSASFWSRSPVLKGHATQAGNDVVQGDRLASDVGTVDAENDFSRLWIVVDREI